MASLTLLSPSPLSALRSPRFTPAFHRKAHRVPSPRSYKSLVGLRPLAAAAAAGSGSPKPLADAGDAAALRPLLQDLAASLDLPPDYLARLPNDLRLDLNDAAFDLANGPVLDECGQELGEMLLNLSRAWEQADTLTSNSIASQLPLLQSLLTENVKSAFGKRLVSAGRRFEAMGQYGQGELQRVAKAMIKLGNLLSASPVIKTDDRPKKESRMLKFGDLQVELTPEKAIIGATISFAFAVWKKPSYDQGASPGLLVNMQILSWQLSQGIQSMPENSLQYANDNASQLAKSLRGAVLVLVYSSAVLSAFASVGLVLLGRQLSSESKSNDL